MAILRSLRKFSQKTSNSRSLFLATPNPRSLLPLRSSIFLSPPISKWEYPFHGPLLLCHPPWKLLQSATPLYFQSHVPPLDLKFPIKLGLPLEANGKDYKIGSTSSLVNWPNLISMSRLVSGPVLGWMIMNETYLPAFLGLVISGLTDWLDGFVARKMGINSVVGSYLDPLADKVLIGCVALAMVEKGLLHSGLVGLIVARDVALVGGALYIRASQSRSWFEFMNLDGTRPQKVEPLMISKVNTCFQLALVAAALLQPEFPTEETELYMTYLSWLVGSTTVASTAAYGAQHLTRKMSIHSKQGL